MQQDLNGGESSRRSVEDTRESEHGLSAHAKELAAGGRRQTKGKGRPGEGDAGIAHPQWERAGCTPCLMPAHAVALTEATWFLLGPKEPGSFPQARAGEEKAGLLAADLISPSLGRAGAPARRLALRAVSGSLALKAALNF